jgi:hypothetical protein
MNPQFAMDQPIQTQGNPDFIYNFSSSNQKGISVEIGETLSKRDTGD